MCRAGRHRSVGCSELIADILRRLGFRVCLLHLAAPQCGRVGCTLCANAPTLENANNATIAWNRVASDKLMNDFVIRRP